SGKKFLGCGGVPALRLLILCGSSGRERTAEYQKSQRNLSTERGVGDAADSLWQSVDVEIEDQPELQVRLPEAAKQPRFVQRSHLGGAKAYHGNALLDQHWNRGHGYQLF